MPEGRKKKSSSLARGRKTATRRPAAKRKPASSATAADKYASDLVLRGEAAPPDASGNLPSGATHEIVGKTATGAPVVRRRRYSAF